MTTLRAINGDITEQRVDVIVNAASNSLRAGGGVSGAIHQAGGPTIARDCIDRFPHGLATSDAGWTTAGDLPARWVIHTVGPNYSRGQRDPLQLASCYLRALQVADHLGAQSIAFPLVGTGAYGWPITDAIREAIQTIGRAKTDVKTAVLVTKDPNVHSEVQRLLDYHQQFLGPLSNYSVEEWARLRHDYDPAPPTDSSRLIIRERTDGEAGVAVILAESDRDYRTYHLGHYEMDYVIDALTRAKRAT